MPTTPDMFDSLPRPTALLLLSTLLHLTADARVLHQAPRQTPAPTVTLPYHALNVVSWPLRPTPAPGADLFAFRRQQLEGTICGYIGGDSALPATCGSGSHCVLDTEHNAVGCCPDGVASCSTGVFTGCVDGNSGPQTEVNPYVFSCAGGSVCYKNTFQGGFSQWGCGTASDQATTVANTASGVTAQLATVSISISDTTTTTTTSEPTSASTSSTSTSSSTDSSTSTSSSSSSSSSSTSSSTTSSTSSSSSTSSTITTTSSSTATDAAAAATSSSAAKAATDTTYRTGAIVGGTIGGLAVLIALLALIFFLLRRRRATNLRRGPGPGGVRGKIISPPRPGGGTGFAALSHDDADAFETGPSSSMSMLLNQPPPPQTAAAAALSRAPPPPLPPLTTTTSAPPALPMPFQSDISPIDILQPHSTTDLETPLAYTASAPSANFLSTSYPPPSSRGSGSLYSPTNAGGFASPPGQPMMGMVNAPGLMLNRGAERQLESDQVPLTGGAGGMMGGMGGEEGYGMMGYHAALGRIGEEDEEEMEAEQEAYRDHVDHAGRQGEVQQQVQGEVMQGQGVGEEQDDGRPVWMQQGRRQSRSLMWM